MSRHYNQQLFPSFLLQSATSLFNEHQGRGGDNSHPAQVQAGVEATRATIHKRATAGQGTAAGRQEAAEITRVCAVRAGAHETSRKSRVPSKGRPSHSAGRAACRAHLAQKGSSETRASSSVERPVLAGTPASASQTWISQQNFSSSINKKGNADRTVKKRLLSEPRYEMRQM